MDCLETSLKDKRDKFQTAVHSWSSAYIRHFAWRETSRAPYDILIAEVMLKRTTAEAVSRIYDDFLRKYPNLSVLGCATEEKLASELLSLGLYSQRAKSLLKLVRYLTEYENGSIPNTLDRLIKVPGLGHYSARAILSFAYCKTAAVVDANVTRVLGRVFDRAMPDNPSIALMQRTADALVPIDWHRKFNFAMLDLGRLVCRPSKPICNACPLSHICDYANRETNRTAPTSALSTQVLKWRRKRGLSIAALAELAAISKMTVINAEAGRTTPRPGTIRKLADALGIHAKLLTG